jgi:Domain of unknown function (DUF4279)
MSETKGTIRVMGPDVEPDEVTRLLGLAPYRAHRAGATNIGRSGRRYADFHEGNWMYQTTLPRTASVDEQLQALVDLVLAREAAFVQLRARGHRLDLYLSVFEFAPDQGFTFPHQLLHTLGRLGFDLQFDLYGAAD